MIKIYVQNLWVKLDYQVQRYGALILKLLKLNPINGLQRQLITDLHYC